MARNDEPTIDDLLEDLRHGFNGDRMTLQGYKKIHEIIEQHFKEEAVKVCKGCDRIVRFVCEECGYSVMA